MNIVKTTNTLIPKLKKLVNRRAFNCLGNETGKSIKKAKIEAQTI